MSFTRQNNLSSITIDDSNNKSILYTPQNGQPSIGKNHTSILLHSTMPKELHTVLNIKPGLIYSNSALRKFVRNVNTRINLKLLNAKQNNIKNS